MCWSGSNNGPECLDVAIKVHRPTSVGHRVECNQAAGLTAMPDPQQSFFQRSEEPLNAAVPLGEPRSMKAVRAPTPSTQCRTASANELQAVVGPDVGRDAAQQDQIGHDLDGTSSGKPPSHADRQALAGGRPAH